MAVDDLIELLQTKFDGNEKVGTVGYFGEFHSMDALDFSKTSTYIQDTAGMRPKITTNFHVLDIKTPWIGDEPE